MDERIIIKWIFKRHDIGLEWIDLAQDRDKWRAVVNKVLKVESSIT
jgi:hypothetical protein